MRRIILSALLIGAALAPAAVLSNPATAADTPKAKRACFYSEDLRNWKEVDPHTVNIEVGNKKVFQLTLLGSCPDLSSALSIGVKTRMGQEFICDGLDIDLITPSPTGPRQCPVTGMRELSPEEVAALPKDQRP
ncbi:MAG: hypothetical protein JWP35_3072 [Caulobacter sp.]|nr:hypothetical protein [Caulobacter sp.]